MGLYQDPQTCGSYPEGAGSQNDSIYRQHSVPGRIQDYPARSDNRRDIPSRMPRVHNKLQEISTGTNIGDGVLRYYYRDQSDGNEPIT